MSAENSTAPAAAAQKASKWSDNEKIALLISINKALGGPPVWSSLSIPSGRTTGSSQKMYESLIKAASLVPMTEGLPVPGQKRKAPAVTKTNKTNGIKNEDDEEDDTVKPAPAKKPRVRKPKAAATAEGDVTEAPVKKRGGRKPKAKSAAEVPAAAGTDDEEAGDVKDESWIVVKKEDGDEKIIGDDLADEAQAAYEKGEVAV